MKTSCISHPEREQLVIIRKWQIEFCDGNQCAAAVMSYFEYWHNWKLDSDQFNTKSNDVAEMHGDGRKLSENVYQFHSMQEISDGILNLYGTKTISEAIKLLVSKNVISIHTNPNPNYFYDKKKYFRFYPEVCSEWLKSRDKSRLGKNAECNAQKGNLDSVKLPNADGKNAALLGKNAVAITKINNKDKNQSIKTHDDFLKDENQNQNLTTQPDEGRASVQPIIDALAESGLAPKHFSYPDTVSMLQRLCDVGADVDVFREAYGLASRASRSFGLNYLAKVVEDLLHKRNKSANGQEKTLYKSREPQYEEDFTQGLHWMGDVLN